MSLNNFFADELRAISEERSTFGRTAGARDSCVSDGFDADIAIEKNEEVIQQEIQAALKRIEAGSIGTCEDCGKKISKARLEAILHKPICIKCKSTREAA